MSKVTGVALVASCPCVDELINGEFVIVSDPVAEIQVWLKDHCHGAALLEVSDRAGGSKHPQFELWCAGVNYMNVEDEFAAFVMSRRWGAPETVILMLQPEEGVTRVFRPPYDEDGWMK
ncbi:hypothetical protein U1839_09790 [Sphingomonas sp. RT2P30]|uniref:hypothetical protein n=1 Tax=Parasphingomonas halimpatiens TaxID=3096162 RepID=UPI002FCA2BD7